MSKRVKIAFEIDIEVSNIEPHLLVKDFVGEMLHAHAGDLWNERAGMKPTESHRVTSFDGNIVGTLTYTVVRDDRAIPPDPKAAAGETLASAIAKTDAAR